MNIDIKQCVQLLKEKNDFLILTHAHPDGDTLGSGFALCLAPVSYTHLDNLFITVYVVVLDHPSFSLHNFASSELFIGSFSHKIKQNLYSLSKIFGVLFVLSIVIILKRVYIFLLF